MSNALASRSDLAVALASAADELALATSRTPILRLLKSGEWVYGAEDTDIEPQSSWAVNPRSLAWGWVAWGDGALLGEVMGPMSKPRPEAPLDGSPWQEAYSVQLTCLNGEDQDTVVLWKGSSRGLVDAFTALVSAVARQAQIGAPIVPVVALETSHYQHKQYGRIYKPVLRIINWVDDTPEAREAVAPQPQAAAVPQPQAVTTPRTRIRG